MTIFPALTIAPDTSSVNFPKTFIAKDADGLVHLDGTVSVSGLGGNPYRDGTERELSAPARHDAGTRDRCNRSFHTAPGCRATARPCAAPPR